MQYFKITHGRYNHGHVVSMKDNDRVIPKFISSFKHSATLNQLFTISDKLTPKVTLPPRITIQELPLEELQEYLRARQINRLVKTASVVSDAWYSFEGDSRLKRRATRKVSFEVEAQIKSLLQEGMKKAQIARSVGLSRNGLYKALEKIEEQEFARKCEQGFIPPATSRDKFEKLDWKERRTLKNDALNRLLKFDVSELKSVNLKGN